MKSSQLNAEIEERFAEIAVQFCGVVNAALGLNREEFLPMFYAMLPRLIDQAIGLPDIRLDGHPEGAWDDVNRSEISRLRHVEWRSRFDALQAKLEDWDSYRQIFDPINDSEPVYGSLSDDLADICGDLQQGLLSRGAGPISPESRIWHWRFSFRTHWGKHAIDALSAVHSRLNYC